MPIRPILLVLLILAVATFVSLPVGAHPPGGVPEFDGGIALAPDIDEIEVVSSLTAGDLAVSQATLSAAPEEHLIRAALDAIVHGPWWLAVALCLAAVLAALRARGLIQHRGLGAVLSVGLSLAGGVAHHVGAGAPLTSDALLDLLATALFIAVGSLPGLLLPAKREDPGRLQERA